MGHAPSVIASHAARTVFSDAAFILPHIKPDMHILDVGSGPGTITTGFLPFVPQGSVTGVDYSEAVVEQARAHAQTAVSDADRSRLKFVVADVLKGLPFPDDTFDLVFSNQVFWHIRQPVLAMKEVRRVCKAGGGMVATRDGDQFHWHPPLRGLELWVRGMFAMGGQQTPGRHMHGYARQAGFEVDRMTVGCGVTCIADAASRKWWGELHAKRFDEGGLGAKMMEAGMSREDVEEMKRAITQWIEEVDGWYALLQSECIFRK